jgi:hypothetical protein
MVIGPAPTIKRATSEPPKRTLAYQERVAKTAEDVKENVPEQQPAAPEAALRADGAEPQDAQAEPEAGADANPQEQGSNEMAALPPGEGAAKEPNALPWQHPAVPNAQAEPGADSEAVNPASEEPDASGAPEGPAAAIPGAEAPPGDGPAGPGEPGDEPQEWVQVQASGVGMRGTASEDAPMLFAFPYGRVLRVVSHYQDWVEVTDPQSAATGWMEARYLAPTAAPGTDPDAAAADNEDEPPTHWRWWRKHGGGFANMINHAFGGR